MPHVQIRAKGHDRDRSLGWLALAWMEYFVVHGPGDVQGDPVSHGDEYSGFIADCYALDENGRRLYDSVFLSRPKGCDKSGLGARIGLFEGLGPCRFAGWANGGEVYRDPWGLGFRYDYEPGEAMGRPVRVPYIRCMATEESQTGNVYDTVYFNLTEGPLADAMARRDDAGLTRVLLPGGGEMTPSTASSASKDGGKETWADFDESHLYNRPELRQMYATVTRNLRKRKKIAETWFLETTTMFADGQDSVAEETYKLAELIRQGKTRRERLLLDHRYGECEDLTDEAELRAAIVDAYGDAIAWNDLDGIVDQVYDPRNDPNDSRRYFLNARSSAADAWLQAHEWTACADVEKVVADRDVITLGFDGSRGRVRGKADATALIGCRVADGHLFQIDGASVWEAGDRDAQDWEPPAAEVEAAVALSFQRYTVVGFYADPSMWDESVARWEAQYGPKLKVKATQKHPVRWPKTQVSTVSEALKRLRQAVSRRDVTHDGTYALTRHFLNARRHPVRSGVLIRKENPESPRKIDAAYAGMLAHQARLDAIAAGVSTTTKRSGTVRRIR